MQVCLLFNYYGLDYKFNTPTLLVVTQHTNEPKPKEQALSHGYTRRAFSPALASIHLSVNMSHTQHNLIQTFLLRIINLKHCIAQLASLHPSKVNFLFQSNIWSLP